MKEDGIAALSRDNCQLIQAAKCYQDHAKTVQRGDGGQPKGYIHPNWPRSWDRNHWQPEDDPQRNVIIAAALLILECERLQEVRDSVRGHVKFAQ